MRYLISILVMVFCIGAFAEDSINTSYLSELEGTKIYTLAQNEESSATAEVVADPEKAEEKEVAKPEEPKSFGDALSLGTQIAKLIKGKNYQLAIAMLLVLLVWMWKKASGFGLFKKWLPVGGKKTTLVAMGMGVALELAAYLMVPGSVWYVAVFQGLLIGGASTGLWDLIAGQPLKEVKKSS